MLPACPADSVPAESVYDHDFGSPKWNKECFKNKREYRKSRRTREWQHTSIYFCQPPALAEKSPEKSDFRGGNRRENHPSGSPQKSLISQNFMEDEGICLDASPISDRSRSPKRGSGSVPRLVLDETPTPPRQGSHSQTKKHQETSINGKEMLGNRRPLTPPHQFYKERMEIGTQMSDRPGGRMGREESEEGSMRSGDSGVVEWVTRSTQTPDSWLRFLKGGHRFRERTVGPSFRLRERSVGRKRRAVSSPPWQRRQGPFAQYGTGNRAPKVCDKKTFNVRATGNKEDFGGENTTAIFDKLKKDKKCGVSASSRKRHESSAAGKRVTSSRKYDGRFITEYQREFCKRYELDTFSSLVHRRHGRKRVVFD